MKKITKAVLIITLMISLQILFSVKEVNAGLQSNPNTNSVGKMDVVANWIKNIRKVETTVGSMGFDETIDEGTLKATSDSNGIDIHMMKSTEYGAIAILSASGYGNSSNANILTTTTGNKTGVIINTNYWEWVAGGLSGYSFLGVNKKYYDAYTASNNSAKIGDALGNASTTNPGCAGWHNASTYKWVKDVLPYFIRGRGGIFSINYEQSTGSSAAYARGVAVVGDGF